MCRVLGPRVSVASAVLGPVWCLQGLTRSPQIEAACFALTWAVGGGVPWRPRTVFPTVSQACALSGSGCSVSQREVFRVETFVSANTMPAFQADWSV